MPSSLVVTLDSCCDLGDSWTFEWATSRAASAANLGTRPSRLGRERARAGDVTPQQAEALQLVAERGTMRLGGRAHPRYRPVYGEPQLGRARARRVHREAPRHRRRPRDRRTAHTARQAHGRSRIGRMGWSRTCFFSIVLRARNASASRTRLRSSPALSRGERARASGRGGPSAYGPSPEPQAHRVRRLTRLPSLRAAGVCLLDPSTTLRRFACVARPPLRPATRASSRVKTRGPYPPSEPLFRPFWQSRSRACGPSPRTRADAWASRRGYRGSLRQAAAVDRV